MEVIQFLQQFLDCSLKLLIDASVLCLACEQEERQHPDYQKAADAELAAVRRGDMNFPGIGWPGKNGRVK